MFKCFDLCCKKYACSAQLWLLLLMVGVKSIGITVEDDFTADETAITEADGIKAAKSFASSLS